MVERGRERLVSTSSGASGPRQGGAFRRSGKHRKVPVEVRKGDAGARWDVPRAWLSVLLLGAATLAPAFLPLGADSLPFSTYPMFSTERTEARIQSARVVLRSGASLPLPPSLLGTGEVLQAKTIIARALRSGPQARTALCQRLAEAASSRSEFSDGVEMQLVEQTYEPVAFFRTEAALRKSKRTRVRARCPLSVARGDR